jgi:hypothetical protein
LTRSDDAPGGKDFIVGGASAFIDNLTPRAVLSACLEENARRLAGFDRRLLVPRLAPQVARLALGVLEWWPRGNQRDGAPRRAHGPSATSARR